MSDDEAADKTERSDTAYRIGVWVQGIVLGLLLFIALCELYVAASGIRLFRYQAF